MTYEEDTSNEIEVSEGGENLTQIRSFVDKLREANITQHTIRRWIPVVNSNLNVLSSQVENHLLQLRKAEKDRERVLADIDDSRLRSLREQRLMPLELGTAQQAYSHHMREITAWTNIIKEVLEIFSQKAVEALISVSDYQVESLAIQRFTKMQEEMNAHYYKIITEMIYSQERKIDNIRESLMEMNLREWRKLQEENKLLQKELFTGIEKMLRTVLDHAAVSMGGGGEGFTESRLDRFMMELKHHFEDSLCKADDRLRDHVRESMAENRRLLAEKDRERELAMKKGLKQIAPPPSRKKERGEFACPYCERDFVDEFQLESHIDLDHSDVSGGED